MAAPNIQLILARDVPNLGHVGELVSVRPGYARNYLVPQGLGLPASPERVAQFNHQKQVVEHKRRLLRAASEERAKEIAQLEVSISAKVGEQGKLFGSVTNRDISAALAEVGQDVHAKDIKLEGSLRTVGQHVVDIRLEADVSTQVKVMIIPEIVVEEHDEDDENAHEGMSVATQRSDDEGDVEEAQAPAAEEEAAAE